MFSKSSQSSQSSMSRMPFSRLLSILFVVFLIGTLPLLAGRRRAVRHPSLGPHLTVTIDGTVLDSVTSAPVVNASVFAGKLKAVTNALGKFKLKDAEGFGAIHVKAERSGYQTKTVDVSNGGAQTITLRMTPTPTVQVKTTDDQTMAVDFESIELGYSTPFLGYTSATFDAFCKQDGTAVEIDRSEMKKVTGPATLVTDAPCCPGSNVEKITIELKAGGGAATYFFSDGCSGNASIDLIARSHVSGTYVYIPFTEIREMTFP